MSIQLRKNAADLTASLVRPRLGGVAEGTRISTPTGKIAVERLTIGAVIESAFGETATLTAITRRYFETLALCRVEPHALAGGRPEAVTFVAPGQHLMLSDWRAAVMFGGENALVPAWRLADGQFIAETVPRAVTLFELHFDTDQAFFANGLILGAGLKTQALVSQVA